MKLYINIKYLFLLIIFFLVNNHLSAQSFSKITEGDIVNEELNSGGCSWADIDLDGDLDIFIANGNLELQPNSLFINNGDGTFSKYSNGEIVNEPGKSIGGVWGDLENDGYWDLFVTNRESNTNFLYSNEQSLNFTKILSSNAVNDPANSNNSYWIDLDNDGDLDLYVINFESENFLYLNDGTGNFTKFLNTSIVQDSDQSIVGAWADYDNDGDLDLLKGVGGDSANILYENKGNFLFERNNDPAINNDKKSTIGASWADFDNDGDFDLFAVNFLGADNSLFINNGDRTFSKVTNGSIVNDGGFSVGSSFGDIDNDGDLDLFVGNFGQNNFLYLNDGPPNYTFTKVTFGAIVSDGGSTFGVSMADFDNDGDLDVFAANQNNQKNFLYKNDGNNNNWISITLKGTVTNKPAIGTKVRLKAIINSIEQWQLRQVESQTGYNSQDGFILEFGLGNAEIIDSIIIEWPGTSHQILTNIDVNQHLIIEETKETNAGNLKSEIINKYYLEQNYPNPFNPVTKINFSIPQSEHVRLTIYDILGNEIAVLADEFKSSGSYEINFDAQEYKPVSSGVYFYSIRAGSFSSTKKMIILK